MKPNQIAKKDGERNAPSDLPIRFRGDVITESWLDLLLDAKALRAIYGTEVPRLDDIYLHEVSVNQNGSASLQLRFDVKFPDNPPEKWRAQGLNCERPRMF